MQRDRKQKELFLRSKANNKIGKTQIKKIHDLFDCENWTLSLELARAVSDYVC